MKKMRSVTLLTVILLPCVSVLALLLARPTLGASTSTSLTFLAEADARVDAANPDTNYGTLTTLRADSDPQVESYLRFSVVGLQAPVVSAKLRVYAGSDGTVNGPAVYSTTSEWTEPGITWNNRPAPTSGATDDKGALAANSWVDYDVTPFVTSNGTFSFILATDSADGITFVSREGPSPPQLVLTLATSNTATATPSPASTASPSPSPTSTASPSPIPTATPEPAPSPTEILPVSDPVLVGAGDISSCSSSGDEATAALLDNIDGTVFTAGDNAYDAGTVSQFANCYDPTWGRHKTRTRPAVGNHEYGTAGAQPYFDYFGAAAGVAGKGYYSYELGAWHIVVLNSNCSQVGGCQAGSEQEQWLRADLAAHPAMCTLAYWHHPRFSSGEHGSNTSVQAFWQALYEAGVDVVLSGHDHDYERFAPQDPQGGLDPAHGIREFVVGMGGRSHYSISTLIANSEVHNADTYGVLKLTLHAQSYDWSFVPEVGKTFTDVGTTACH